MIRKIIISAAALFLMLFLPQSLALGAPATPADTLILFTPNDLAALPGTQTLYLADGADKCLVAADLQTGQTQTLSLPYTPTKIAVAGGSVYVALSTPDSGIDSVAVVDPETFSVSGTIPIDLDISGMAADGTYLYVYNSSKLEAFDASGTKLSTLSISNLRDLKANTADGNLYGVAYGSAVCIGAPAGQLSLLKQNASYSGSSVMLLPDGKNLLLSSGAVLTCNADPAKALTSVTRLLDYNAACMDADGNELYLVTDRLIQVYDASTFAAKRVLAQTEATNYLLFSSGKLIFAQKDSTNNLDFRAVDPGALLTGLKLNGDAISELYPLQFTVDGGTVPNAETSVTISATTAKEGCEVTGNIGTVPLAVGKNPLSISVKNDDTGITQTYAVTITRAAKDFPEPVYNAFANLGFIPKDFIVDQDRQAAYLTAANGYSLFRVDMTTGKITEKQFTLPAERLMLQNGSIFVTLLRSGHTYSGSGYGYGAVAVVDADTFATKAIFNTDVDPYDITADGEGNVYLSPGSNQWSILASYDGNTGAFISNAGIYYDCTIERNPVSGKLYSITSGLSPADIYAYETSSGSIMKVYDNSNNRNYSLKTYFKVSPDGKYIFNGSGCIFTSAPIQTGDMVYNGTLGSTFNSICFNLADKEFYAANGKTLTVYDYESRSVKDVYTLADTIVDMAYSGGNFTLLQENANQQYYIRTLAIGNHAADLASLGVAAGTLSPAFNANRLSYSLVLPAGTASITVTPVTLDNGATFTIDGSAVKSKTLTLDQGGTALVTIAVLSQDKELVQTYTLFVYRQTADCTMIISPAFFTPTQQISAGGALYLAAKGQPFLYKFDGASGTFSALPLPGVPNALGCAGSSVFAAMEDMRTNTFSIGVIDTGTFTLADSFTVDTRFTGIRGDDDTIYAFTSSVIKGYARQGYGLVFSKTISIADVEPDSLDGMVYIAAGSIASYQVKGGQLTLVKTNSNCTAQAITVMPDGMHLVLPTGAVLRCSSNPAYDLTPEAVTLPSLGNVSVDATTNELYSVADSYRLSYPYDSDCYLISVYDASDFSYNRTISDPTPMQSVLGSSGCLYVAQKDSQGDMVLRASYSDAMLQAVKVNGDVKDGLYPLRSSVEVGEMPASATTADIEAVAALPGDVISGDTGTQPLAAEKNVLSLTVKNPSTGHAQTYSITVNRRSSDPAALDGRVNLGFQPLDVALDPDRSVEYMTAANDKNLYRVDLQTGAITEKTFSVPVERLAVANGKLYATLLRTGHQYYGNGDGFGAVAVIDTATFATTAVFSTNIDPYDIAADDAGNIFLAPGSAQWSLLASYSADTGALLSEVRQVFNDSYIDWNPLVRKVYLVSPWYISAFETSAGVLTGTYNSSNDNYSFSSYERVSPDGSRIFNGAGTMFACKTGSDGDMAYLGTLGTTFATICFDISGSDNRFYTAQGNALTVYDYSTKKALNTLTFQDDIADLQADGSQIEAVLKNGSGQYYTREITPDTFASSITVSGQPVPGFSPFVHDYSILLASNANTADISVSTFDPDATVSGNTGTQALNSGDNTLTVTVKGAASGLSGVYTLHITNPALVSVTGVSLNKTSTTIFVGATEQLSANVTPANATNKSVAWSSDNSGVAGVSGGLVTGVSPGVAVIKATSQDGSFVGQCTVTVRFITVTFDSQDGSKVPSASAAYHSTVSQPASPKKTGYTFGGWYKDAACKNAWNFATDKVTADITLYAGWTINTYTVTFNSQGGSTVASKTAQFNTTITAPAAPARTGYAFVGWYKELSCIHAWNFSADKVAGNVTLYARWIELPAAPAGVKAVSTSCISIQISWNAVFGAAGYDVWREVSGASSYSPVGTTSSVFYSNSNLTTGSKYYFKVRAYRLNGSIKVYGGWSTVVSATPVPAIPTIDVASASYNSIGISWSAVAGAGGYEVCQATSSAGTFTKIYDGTAFSYLKAGLQTNHLYYYKVRAYCTVGATRIYGDYSIIKNEKPIPSAPAGVKAVRVTATSVRVSWSTVAGATMYEIYRSTANNGSFTYVTASLNWTNTGLKTGRTYWYQVRAYKLVDGVKVYGDYSSVVYVNP